MLSSARLQTEHFHVPRLLLLPLASRLRQVAVVFALSFAAEVVGVAMTPPVDKLRTQLRVDVEEPATFPRPTVALLRRQFTDD